MSVDERMKGAKENHVCFSCLKKAGREQRQAHFSRRRQCTKSDNGVQCTSTHHPLLNRNNSVNLGVAFVTDNQDSLLPVISANICGQNGLYKRANVLLDSGAQISLIRREPWEKDPTSLPDNKAQAVIRSTERRLARHQKQGAAYDLQMVKMGFARKLSKEDMNTVKRKESF